MKKYHNITAIEISDETLSMRIDGKQYRFKLSEISEKLTNSSKIEREKYEISPSGYGLHWPLLDEDLSIDGLLGVNHTPKEFKKTAHV